LPKSTIRQLWFERFTLKEHIGVAEMLGDNRKRLILIDDHILVRQGLERLLNLGDKFVVCEETGDAASGLELVRELRPDEPAWPLTELRITTPLLTDYPVTSPSKAT
jgi:hypothetical protein